MDGQSEKSLLNKNSHFNNNKKKINLYKSTRNEVINSQNIGINKIINQNSNCDY